MSRASLHLPPVSVMGGFDVDDAMRPSHSRYRRRDDSHVMLGDFSVLFDAVRRCSSRKSALDAPAEPRQQRRIGESEQAKGNRRSGEKTGDQGAR